MDVTPPAPTRRLTLMDLIGFIAASAAGVGGWIFQADFRRSDVNGRVPTSWSDGIALGTSLIIPVALAIVLKGVRLPREERFQPGYVACLGVAIAWIVNAVEHLAQLPYLQATYRGVPLAWLAFYCSQVTAWRIQSFEVAVAVGWLVVLWAGTWRRSMGTVETFGRGVGLWFLGIVGAEWCSNFAQMCRQFGLLRWVLLFGAIGSIASS